MNFAGSGNGEFFIIQLGPMPEYSLKFFCISVTALSELTDSLQGLVRVSVTGQNEISLDILVATQSVLQVVKNCLVAPSCLGSVFV